MEFFKSLPAANTPSDLRSIPLISGPPLSADQWLEAVKDQVVLQYQTIKNSPNLPGFLGAPQEAGRRAIR